nr:hypothetical protein [uncultured Mediterraneibacter sp.]
MKLYCDLYISECWKNKKAKIIKKLKADRVTPQTYVITLSQGERNHLEFYSGMLLKQHFYDDSELFVVGIADGYDECLLITQKLTEEVFRHTGGADLRSFILERQKEYEKAGRRF